MCAGLFVIQSAIFFGTKGFAENDAGFGIVRVLKK